MTTYCAKATGKAPGKVNLGYATTPVYGWATKSGLSVRAKDWRAPTVRFETNHKPKLIKARDLAAK